MTKEALKLALDALEDRTSLMKWQMARDAVKEALAQPNEFNPDWDAMAVMVEEQQRMAKRIAELEAQPEQEPVACVEYIPCCTDQTCPKCKAAIKPELVCVCGAVWEGQELIYTTPQRKPLTDEEIDRLWSQSLADTEGETYLPLREFARAIEAAHGIKEKNT